MLVQPLLALAACAVVALAAPAPQNTPPPSPNITDIYYATEILDACPGYTASNVVQTDSSLTADLTLAGTACNQFGNDLHDLKLVVEYQTNDRLHVKIFDAEENVFQVQEQIMPRPKNENAASSAAALKFDLVMSPFSFTVTRKSNNEVLFDTSAAQLIFEDQYLRLRTKLPANPNLYGLGEHSDAFRLTTSRYERVLWNAESPYIPNNANLYGSHPVYFDHRGDKGTHGVFFLNSNEMAIDLNKTQGETGDQYLEYNTIGGIVDLYFLAGDQPAEVSKQYADVVGYSAMYPYWVFGFHQCKYGYQDVYMVAEVVANYSNVGIPLEVMWTDIDYMDRRRDFTTDPDRYPQKKMKELVDTLHERQQRYVLILDPGVLASDPDYEPYKSGHEKGVFLKYDTSVSDQDYLGAQWAGIAAWPDWFANSTQDWWTDEILKTFDSETGVGIDGVWVDMNEASNFCQNRNCNLTQQGIDNPPAPTAAPRPGSPRPIPGFPADFQPGTKARRSTSVQSRQSQSGTGQHLGLPDRDFFTPKFHINNAKGGLSDYTLYTNLTNADGSKQYDTHNFYGHMMSHTTQASMLQRRPGLRPFVLTRSTFAGTGRKVAHWFGDNESSWEHYRTSIRQMLAFVSMHQMPMVGSDVCGFNSNADQYMCARWALLGAFQPFYRNHAERSTIPQEFYQWPITIEAGTKAVNTRYKLIDYAYTALYYQTTEGTPMINPLFFLYPTDANTFAIQEQWFFGDALLISPVTADYSDTVTFYLPKDTFYDYWTHELVEGLGANVTRSNVSWTDIPVHIRGGTIIPERANSSNTTAMLRREDFVLLIAPDSKGMAKGRLYLDDGESIDQQGKISEIAFAYDNGKFTASGSMAYMADGAQNQGESLTVNKVIILGQTSAPANGTNFKYNSAAKEVQVTGPWKFTGGTWSFDINGPKPRYGAPRKY